MSYNFADSGYVDVAERIRQLKAKHPEAVLRPANPLEPFKIMEIGGREFIVYTAACYRSPDDPMPAIAVAAEPANGKTNFTRDSEVMNAETSAWGRAILAALACDSQKVASANEVRNRVADQEGDNDDSWRDTPPVEPKRAEMGSAMRKPQTSNPQPARAGVTPMGGSVASEKQVNLIKKLGDEMLGGQTELADALQKHFGGKGVYELTSTQASSLIKMIMDKKV